MFYLTPLGVVIVTWAGWLRIALFLLAYAVLIMIGFGFVLRALDNTRKAKMRRAREMPMEAREKIEELALQVADGLARERILRSQNGRLRAKLAEECNHGRNWRSEAQALLHEEVPQ
jgi:ABC-type multidrug transport system fused ATPase/permease subunit